METGTHKDLAAAAGIGAIPLLGGIGKKTHIAPMTGKNFGTKADMFKAIKPGDLIFSGSPWGISRRQNVNKAMISAVMGNPSGYHPLLVERVNKNGTLSILELSSEKGFQRGTYTTSSPDHFTLLRPKSDIRPAVKRMGKIVDVNNRLDVLLKRKGLSTFQINKVRASAHAGGGREALAVAGRELFIPSLFKRTRVSATTFDRSVMDFEKNLETHAESIAKSITKSGKLPKSNPLACLGGMCTTPLARAGMPVGEKSSLRFVGPNDFLRSKNYQVIGFSAGKSPGLGGRLANAILKRGPSIMRLGAGLTLGSMAYSMLKSGRMKK